MAYPRNHLRLVVSGTLYGSEQFAYGVNLIRTTDGAAAPTTVPAAVLTAVETYHQAASTAPALVNLIKLNEIGVDGKYIRQSTVLHDYGTTPKAGGGAASRGRFYLPIPNVGSALGGDGRVTVVERDNQRTFATTFISSLNAAVPGWSVGVVSDVGVGRERTVRNVRVGRVLDTMRSRRTSLVEDYSVGPEVGGYVATDFGGGGGGF
jgi:hypothetical protein